MEWDKGCALNYLLDTLGLGASSDVLPIYIGDDRTDEDAFEVTLFHHLLLQISIFRRKPISKTSIDWFVCNLLVLFSISPLICTSHVVLFCNCKFTGYKE